MSGTDQFRAASGPRGSAAHIVREHLGDRLAAFVDGELGDDARERVLSHLATCEPCKAEADEQRCLKNAVATALPPALSAGLLARLQGLSGGPGGPGDPFGGPPGGAGPDGAARRGGLSALPGLGELFGPPTLSRPSSALPGAGRSYLRTGGFAVHEVGRAASRGRRLAFAAAGAFSLAALVLGAAVSLETGVRPRVEDPGTGTATTPIGLSSADSPSAVSPLTPVWVDETRPVLAPLPLAGESPSPTGSSPVSGGMAARSGSGAR